MGAACITGCFGFPQINHILMEATTNLGIECFDKGPGKKPVGWRLDQLKPDILKSAQAAGALGRQRRLDGLPEVIRAGISEADFADYLSGAKIFTTQDLWDTEFDDIEFDGGKILIKLPVITVSQLNFPL